MHYRLFPLKPLSIYLSIYRLNLKPFLGVLALMLALAPPAVANPPCSPTGKLPLIIRTLRIYPEQVAAIRLVYAHPPGTIF